MKKRDQIDLLLDSVKNIQKAEPSPFLFEKIKTAIDSGNLSSKYSTESNPIVVWFWAFSISLVITLNIIFISKQENNQTISHKPEPISLVSSEFNYTY
jgi:hypothetical protein